MALRQASLIKNDWRFNECTIITNLEPCTMCSSALIQARMGKVIFGAYDKKRGGLGGSIDLSKHESAHHKMEIIGGILEDECSHDCIHLLRYLQLFPFCDEHFHVLIGLLNHPIHLFSYRMPRK